MTGTSGYRNVLLALHAGATGAVALAVLILSVTPPLYLKSAIPANFGLASHCISYGILCILTGIWLHVADKTSYPVLYAALLSSLFRLFIEFVQCGVSYRSFEISES